MFNARLLALFPTVRISVIVSVAARWLALLAQVVLFAWLGAFAASMVNGSAAGGAFSFLLAGGFAVPGVSAVALLILRAVASWSAERAGSSAGAQLGQMVFNRVVELGPKRSGVMSDSEITTLMGEGLGMLRPYFSKYVPQFIYAVLAPVTLFVITMTFNAPAAIVLLICVPLMPMSIMMLMRRAKKFMGDYWGTYVDLGGAFLDAVRGLTTLKVFGADARAHEQLDAQAEDFRQITMKLLRVQLQSVTFMDLFTYGGIAVGCAVACVQVALGFLGLADAITIVLFASGFFLPMRTFGSYFHTGMNANPVIDQVFSLIDAQSPEVGDKVIEGAQITIKAHDLAFSYAGKNAAQESEKDTVGTSACQLEGIDLAIAPNSFIGIAGPSGSGKSTFASLLAGDLIGYDGSLTVNGLELAEVAPASIHETVTLVSGASHVFRGSFRSNLTIAAPEAGDGVLWDALRRARLADFVYESGGLDAPVEADGANLSGGQRQRLVFARALLRNTPVYVFDEATANIDAESERYLLAAIQKIALSKTVIVISHRLPVLRYADEILVMSEGSVVERGTHEQLLSAGGTYRSMWDSSAELEAFAASVVDELPDEEPSPVEEALNGMPGMMAGVMRAFMGIVEAEKYQSIGSDLPKGHPAWIPLPNYQAGMSRRDAELACDDTADVRAGAQGDTQVEEGLAADVANAQSDVHMPAFMGLADATAEGADNEAIKQAMRQIRDHMQRPQKVRVVVEPLPPAHRHAFAIVKKCLALTSDMVPQLVLAVVLGALGWLLTCGAFVFAAAGLLFASSAVTGGLSFEAVALCVVGSIVCALVRGPVHYVERLLTHDCTFGTVADIRSHVFGILRTLAPAKVDGRDAGDLISLLTSDIEILEGFYSRALVPVCAATLAVIICVVVALFVNVPAAVTMAVFYAIVGAIVPAIGLRVTRERGAELRAYAVLMTGFLLDSLRGMRDLLTFGRAQEYADELGEHLDSMSSGERGHARLTAFLSALPHALAQVGAFVLAGVCAQQVACGVLDPAGAVALIVGYIASVEAMCAVAGLGTSFHQVLAAADRVLDVMEDTPVVTEAQNALPLESFEGLAFEHVTFGYEDDTVAVDDATFAIDPETFVGISGKSGVGKTTLLKLAMRFWDTREGSVRINGTDVREVRMADIHRLISYMVQHTYLFEGSLRENLLVACPNATDNQIEEALEKAALLDTVRSWPNGLDTMFGSGGSRVAKGEQNEAACGVAGVSDGERQRIGLARAFLHDAPLFLLDEPTSNLDALNEATILRSLVQYAQGKTVVIVSHRRAVAAIVDKLLVVE